ncbi:MAG: PAS domain S-box protein [Deltaproteobacteria bacterium]|nr:PAS domain S-box protein [Candidatus Anaeroferrophillus wilburensis]MBN2888229.1 PAS domain S-box protein [Deltaproteobacteria bacterium]
MTNGTYPETLYQQLCANMMDAFGVADVNGRVIEANQLYLDLVGYTKDELLELSIFDLTPTKWHSLEKRIIDEQVLVKGYSDIFEKEILRKDGSIVPVELRIVLAKDPNGQPMGMWAIVRDISLRLAKEDALRRFQLSVASSPDAVFWINAEGQFPYVNAQACRSLGYSRDELMQLNLWDIDVGFTQELWGPHWQNVRKSGGARLERLHRRKDGTVFPVEISSTNIDFEDQVHHVAYVRDISDRVNANNERKKLEAQLIQSQKMESVGRLAGGVAHDFNNMLSVIMGYSELIKIKLAPDDQFIRELEQIQQATKRAQEITQQLLAFSRKQVFEPKVLNINDLISSFENNLSRLIGEDITLEFFPSRDIRNIEFDQTQIEQILMNLAINARDAMPAGGSLTFETANVSLDEAYCRKHIGFIPGDFVQISVSDNGIGMDAENIDHIFEPFFTTKEIGKGTGLGLSTVYGIVKQGGGFINVYSEPDRGTTFRIYIPASTGEAEPLKIAENQEPVSGSETVFLVEDDEMVREVTEISLRELGYTVVSAAGPEEAIAVFAKEQDTVDLLITDVVMPKMNGKVLYERLKSVRPDLKVLYMSGYTANIIVNHGVLDKGVQFISKPFNIRELSKKVHESLKA